MATRTRGAGLFKAALILTAGGLPAACATVKIEAPDEPIEINLNVKIDQQVRVSLDREIEDLIAENPDIF
ncbi:MAG: YnbE family lipoprotein [Parvularculaceae bacterium]